jgi:hypothetical protein
MEPEHYIAAKNFMTQWHKAKGKLPLIIGIELYEYFGQWVQIVETAGPIQVVVEERFGNRQTVDFEELEMKR